MNSADYSLTDLGGAVNVFNGKDATQSVEDDLGQSRNQLRRRDQNIDAVGSVNKNKRIKTIGAASTGQVCESYRPSIVHWKVSGQTILTDCSIRPYLAVSFDFNRNPMLVTKRKEGHSSDI